jgi:Flp pilus assembly pilin Flp
MSFSPAVLVALFYDESGDELVEYALVLSLFAIVSMVTVRLMATTANSKVEIDETNYTNAFVNGY